MKRVIGWLPLTATERLLRLTQSVKALLGKIEGALLGLVKEKLAGLIVRLEKLKTNG